MFKSQNFESNGRPIYRVKGQDGGTWFQLTSGPRVINKKFKTAGEAYKHATFLIKKWCRRNGVEY